MAGSSAPHFFRRWSADEDPAELLKPENQWSTPWGGLDHGRCDKCGGSGRTRYRCASCLERGAEPDCAACSGRLEFLDVCPTCEGDGVIDRTKRRGVSVFPSVEGLYRYMAERDGDPADLVVEVEGTVSEERDLDADAGALLVLPTRIVTTHPFDKARLQRLRASVGS